MHHDSSDIQGPWQKLEVENDSKETEDIELFLIKCFGYATCDDLFFSREGISGPLENFNVRGDLKNLCCFIMERTYIMWNFFI